MTTKNVNQLTPEEARAILWNQGTIHWLLHPGQKSLYDSYFACKEKIIVWNCSRRFGKSWTLCTLAIETCLRKPNAIVKYCCSKQVDAKGIIRPLIREIIRTCPKELKPTYKVYERAYIFPNGSRIELSGLDGGRAESIRGGSCDLAIIDEAGLVGDLKYIMNGIIIPTTLTTKGKIVLASTPPKTPDHPFVTFYVERAKAQGNLVEKTVYDNPTIDKYELDKIKDETGGEYSNEFRREYLCEIIKDENKAVVPEFDKLLAQRIVKPWVRPPFYDGYVAMDLGLKDLTVVLFGYYDFKNDKIIIDDEYIINGQKMNTAVLAEGIRKKEKEVFTDRYTGETKFPYMRVCDNNLIVINDLRQLHGFNFVPTRKDDADAALNNMRMMLASEKIIINPRCKTLIAHLEKAIWNKARTSYERSSDNGHFDAVDALKYLVRNIHFNKNPYPASYGRPGQENIYKVREVNDPSHAPWKKAFNIK